MNSPHVIESATPELVRVVQVTDCHVYAAADARLHDINTRASLRAVLDLVRLRDPDADLVLATGDLSQDGSTESYRYLAAEFDQLGSPVVWIPGNHDDPTAMAQNLVSPNILPARRVLAGRMADQRHRTVDTARQQGIDQRAGLLAVAVCAAHVRAA